jgi:hypothetical protein
MKITKSQLKQIIKEELGKVLNETEDIQHHLAYLNAKADDAFAAGDREAYEAIVNQMIELENTHLDAGGELPPPRHKDQEDPDDYDDDYGDDSFAYMSAGLGTDEDYGYYGDDY